MSYEKTERIKAIITIVVTAGVNIANLYGFAMDADQATQAVLTIFSFATILYSWWKNQNVTALAAESQRYLDHIRAEANGTKAGE